jgi:signal transduction histidine kinase
MLRAQVRAIRGSRWAIDWLPVVVLPPVLVIDAALSSLGKPITVLSVLAGIVGCLPLVLRRRVSFPAQVAPLVGGIVLVLWQLHPVQTVVLIPMWALFECARRGDRRQSMWMSVAVVPCVVVSVIPFARGVSHVATIVVENLALCLLAIAVGDVLRSRHRSAEQMVAAAEQETLRRVADERLRLAREIHDVVAHAMTAINVQAGVAAHLLERDPGQAHTALRHIKSTSGEALNELRSTLDALRDPEASAPIGVGGVRFSLHDLAPLTEGLRSAGVAVDLEVGRVDELSAAVQSAGYRIIQEALTNVARHAAASNARVAVRRSEGSVEIEIVDDGIARATATATADDGGARASGSGAADGSAWTAVDLPVGGGNGLRGMRERAAALGGTLDVGPAPAGGWRVRARLPLTDPAGGER